MSRSEDNEPSVDDLVQQAIARTPNLKPGNEALERLRKSYQPSKIKVLFVGESPPFGGTFFYKGDSILYNYTREAFSRTFGADAVRGRRFLSFFKESGCYLDDLCLRIGLDALRKDPLRRQLRSAWETSLTERMKAYDPVVIITVMKEIAGHVKLSAKSAGLSSVPSYLVPFPAYKNDREYVFQLTDILRAVKAEGTL